MPLILTGVGIYSTTYLDENGNERRVKLRHGQDAEALGLPPEVLERFKKLSRKVGHRDVPYFTESGKKKAEPPRKVEEPAEAPRKVTSAAHMNATVKSVPVLAESVTEQVEQPKENKEDVPEHHGLPSKQVDELPGESPDSTPAEEAPEAEEKPKKKPAAKKGSSKKGGTKKKAPAKKAAEPKKDSTTSDEADANLE